MGNTYISIPVSNGTTDAPVDFFLLVDFILETTFYVYLYTIPLEDICVSPIYKNYNKHELTMYDLCSPS